MSTTTPAMAKKTKVMRTKLGSVVSTKMDKTIVVAIEHTYPHRLYQKYVRKTRKISVHDAMNQCTVGDIVRIRECRPMAKSKSWTLEQIVLAQASRNVAVD